jgi:hypothetical protein
MNGRRIGSRAYRLSRAIEALQGSRGERGGFVHSFGGGTVRVGRYSK